MKKESTKETEHAGTPLSRNYLIGDDKFLTGDFDEEFAATFSQELPASIRHSYNPKQPSKCTIKSRCPFKLPEFLAHQFQEEK